MCVCKYAFLYHGVLVGVRDLFFVVYVLFWYGDLSLSFVVLRNGAWEIVHWEKVLQQMVFHIPIASLSSSLKMSWHTLRHRVRNDYAYKDAQWCKPEQVWFEKRYFGVFWRGYFSLSSFSFVHLDLESRESRSRLLPGHSLRAVSIEILMHPDTEQLFNVTEK